MSVGGEIKSVLTLDVTKFSAAVERATSNLDALDKKLKSAKEVTDGFESSVSGLGKDITGTADKFKSLEQTLSGLTSKLNQVANSGLDNLSSKSRKAKKDIDDTGASAEKLGTGIMKMTDWIKQYGTSLESLKPSLQGAVTGQQALTKAQEQTAKGASKSVAEQLKAQIKALEGERVTNAKVIEAKQKLAVDLRAIEHKIANDAAQIKFDADLRYFGKNKNGPKAQAAQGEINRLLSNSGIAGAGASDANAAVTALRVKNTTIAESISLLRAEASQAEVTAQAEIAAASKAKVAKREAAIESANASKAEARIRREQAQMWAQINRANRAEAKETARQESELAKWLAAEQKKWNKQKRDDARAERKERMEGERAVANVIKQINRDIARDARETANERRAAAHEAARSERESAQQLTTMWRGMAQMWAASKVEQGLSAGLTKASEYQQAENRVKLLNLPAAEFEEFKAKAFDITKEEKYLSTMDAMQSRLDALTAIGANHKDVIDSTLQSALRNAQVMISSGYEHGSRSDTIKNLYGFAESRQVMNDPEKVRESFDIARRMGVASGGKINIGDMETVARSMGDLRQTMTKDGWLGVASLMEQFKVAGGAGGAGGAGAGVSSVGTILKMMSLYGAGKPVTNIAATQLLGAGVMNDVPGGDKMVNGGFGKALKTAGFKGTKEMQANPVEFFSGLRGQLMTYMKGDKQKDKYFEGGDTGSDEAESAALKRFFAKMGMSNKTVDGMLIMTNKAFIERSENVRKLAKDAADEQQSVELMKETWANAADEMKAGADKLGAAFAPLLVPLAEIPKAIGSILTSASEFVKDNQFAAGLTTIGVAVGGITLGISGMLSVFGSSFGAMAGYIGAGISGVGTFGASIVSLGGFVAWLGKRFLGLGGALLLGWDIGSVVAKFKVSGLEISKHISNAFVNVVHSITGLLIDAEEAWNGFVGRIFGSDYANRTKDVAEVAKKRAANEKYKVDMTYESPEQKEKDRGALRMKVSDDPRVAALRESVGHAAETNTTVAVKDVGDPFAKSEKHMRTFGDQFTKVFENIRASAEETRLKIKALVDGEGTYEQQGKAFALGKLLSQQLDDGGDPTKRSRVKKGFKYDAKLSVYKNKDGEIVNAADAVDMGGKYLNDTLVKPGDKGYDQGISLNDIARVEAERLKGVDSLKAITSALTAYEAVSNDASDADLRAAEGLSKRSAAYLALEDKFRKEEAKNPAASTDANYTQEKKKALDARQALDARLSLVKSSEEAKKFTEDTLQKTAEISASFLTNADGSVIEDADKIIAQHKATVDKYTVEFAKTITALQGRINESSPGTAQDAALAEKKSAIDAYTAYLAAQSKKQAEDLLSPLAKLALEWQKIDTQIAQMEASWATGFMSTFTDSIVEGKADWSSFMKGILKDILSLQMKNVMGDVVNTVSKGIGEYAKSIIKPSAAGDEAGQGLFSKAGDWLASFGKSLFGASKTADGLAGSIADTVVKGADQVIAMTTTMTAEQAAANSLWNLSSAASAASASMGGGGGGGGILGAILGGLTGGSSGSMAAGGADFGNASALPPIEYFAAMGGINAFNSTVPLHAYANGGIARSPQLALFGEAGPEAYVPLPDGRTIPVTMSGSGAATAVPSVTVNVINQSGQQVSAQQGQPRFDGKQMVLDIVLSAVNQPGAFRSGMKGALA